MPFFVQHICTLCCSDADIVVLRADNRAGLQGAQSSDEHLDRDACKEASLEQAGAGTHAAPARCRPPCAFTGSQWHGKAAYVVMQRSIQATRHRETALMCSADDMYTFSRNGLQLLAGC